MKEEKGNYSQLENYLVCRWTQAPHMRSQQMPELWNSVCYEALYRNVLKIYILQRNRKVSNKFKLLFDIFLFV